MTKLKIVPDVVATCCGDNTKTAEYNSHDDINHGVILLGLGGHLVVHDFYSSLEIR